MNVPESDFTCPECGSHEPAESMMVEPVLNESDPWNAVMQIIVCAQCKCRIPAHLAELWDGMTSAEARKEWRATFRKGNKKAM